MAQPKDLMGEMKKQMSLQSKGGLSREEKAENAKRLKDAMARKMPLHLSLHIRTFTSLYFEINYNAISGLGRLRQSDVARGNT